MTIANNRFETNFYLYLNLNAHSAAKLPRNEAVKAFCSGYVCALYQMIKDDDKVVDMELGSKAQMREIRLAISRKSNKHGSMRLNRKDHDLIRNDPFVLLGRRIDYYYGARISMGEVDDSDPQPVSTFEVQKGFVDGYQTAFYLQGERETLPVGLNGSLWTIERADELAEIAKKLLEESLTEFCDI